MKTLGNSRPSRGSAGSYRGGGSGGSGGGGGRGFGRTGGRGIWDPVTKTLVYTSAGDDRVAPAARDLLTQLFEDPRTIKLGWGLSNSDIAKMRSAAKGK
jgi:hypothetical protein